MPDAALGRALLAQARAAIAGRLGVDIAAPPEHPRLSAPGATFVTLTQQGDLRGCIGSLEAYRSLREDVRENACAAAFHDRRFDPLTRAEFADTEVEVSLLGPAETMQVAGESDLLQQLRAGQDGLILSFEGRRATFLPQVWESLPVPGDFVRHLKRKAGLAENFWSDAMHFARYGVSKWKQF
ncbi:MAG: AmmeMemoRadiSam system protein A [Rhodocyclaceae bacterium]|nr:AmmeMemoRadiSam system protein A [Rhodocyclaceae bacterium]MBX3667159.1 AmmeMemoRadiSam system protein A [Rhodocyclaceae bacterium]